MPSDQSAFASAGVCPSRQTRAIFTLVSLATVLPELFSGSTPVLSFLTQPGLLLFLLLGYGAAVLLVRELAARSHVGLLGLFVLGLGYSLFNEGLLAKTLVQQAHLPVPLYDHYGDLLGISFPWAAAIGAWHACASVLFPVALTHYFFPAARATPWLSGKLAAALGSLLLLFGCAVFLSPSANRIAGTPTQLAILLALMAVMVWVGASLKGVIANETGSSRLGPLLVGVSVLVPFWGLGWLAAARLPPLVFFLSLGGVVLLYAGLLRRLHALRLPGFLYFGIGWYSQNAIQAVIVIGGVQDQPCRALLTALADAAILLGVSRWIRQAAQSAEAPPGAAATPTETELVRNRAE